jgi:hypothetical protein
VKLSALYEGFLAIVKSHPGGLGGSGHIGLRGKERLSFLNDDRDDYFGGILTKNIKTGTKYIKTDNNNPPKP